jgi:hypothetical protein
VDIDQGAGTFVVGWVPEQDDYRVVLSRPAFRRQRLRAGLLAALLVVLGIPLIVTGSWLPGTIMITGGGVLLLWMAVLFRQLIRVRWRNDPILRDPTEYAFDGNGVTRRQADMAMWWGWSRITGYEEQGSAFLLRLGSGQRPALGPALVLPKRAMPDPAQQAALRSILESRTIRF